MEIVKDEILSHREAYELIYLELKKTKNILTPKLDKLGFDTLEKINNESVLIYKKQSKLNKKNRDLIINLCKLIVTQYNYLITINNVQNIQEN